MFLKERQCYLLESFLAVGKLIMFMSPVIWVEGHSLSLCFVPFLFCMVPEAESQPSRAYLESLQQLKDMLGELEGKQLSIASGLSEPSKVESALQQAKVTPLCTQVRKGVTPGLSPSLLLPCFQWGN